jgi:hypothetical protein
MLSPFGWLKIGFERLGEQPGRNVWMIRDRDRQLCEQRLGSLIPVLHQMRPDLDHTQAEISTVPLPLEPSCRGLQLEGSPMTGQKTFTSSRKPPVMQPGANSPARRNSGGPADAPHAFR